MGLTTATPLYQRIYTLVQQVPPGRVTTYGQLARLVATTPRVVGFALAALPENSDIPWQRVINAKGRISQRGQSDRAELQYQLLINEGVSFDETGAIKLADYLMHF